jgi:NAD(P)-dependent dehydrogenase (short-subunit alcohol dehydrogenase family)
VAEAAVAAAGGVDVLVNNAAAAVRVPVADTDAAAAMDEWIAAKTLLASQHR